MTDARTQTTPTVATHNTYGYQQGCRCDVCRAANADVARRYRAKPEKRQRESVRARERYRETHPNARVVVSRDVLDALRFITGETGDSPSVWLAHYRQHGGGYEGLQAVARVALDA